MAYKQSFKFSFGHAAKRTKALKREIAKSWAFSDFNDFYLRPQGL